MKPCFPRYNSIWDPNLVLEFLSKMYPNEDITLENLSKKTMYSTCIVNWTASTDVILN